MSSEESTPSPTIAALLHTGREEGLAAELTGGGRTGSPAMLGGVECRWLPAGDPRSLPRLDAEAAGRNAAGEDVHVVYSARGDRFMIVPRSRGSV